METKILQNGNYLGYRENEDSGHRYIVYQKVPMNNLPGCGSFFRQEVYRSWNMTKKFKSYFGI